MVVAVCEEVGITEAENCGYYSSLNPYVSCRMLFIGLL